MLFECGFIGFLSFLELLTFLPPVTPFFVHSYAWMGLRYRKKGAPGGLTNFFSLADP